jgi:hypothetical protein
MGLYRYYLCPDGMISLDELPAGWGLLYVRKSRIWVARQSNINERDGSAEMDCMLSAIRRIGENPPEGVSIKFYTIRTRNRASMYLRED